MIYNALGASGNIAIAHGISNIGIVINAYGHIQFGTNQLVFPRIASDGNLIGVDTINNTNVNLWIATAFGSNPTNLYLVLEYTKTTD